MELGRPFKKQMNFVTKKGTETHTKLMALQDRISECRKAAAALLDELGFEKYTTWASHHSTGIASIIADKQPTGFKQVKGYKQYAPRKDNKEMVAKFTALPVITDKDINDIIGFSGFQMVGRYLITAPSYLAWHEDFCIFRFQRDVSYTPKPDITEILTSEFLKYQAIIEEQKELLEPAAEQSQSEPAASGDEIVNQQSAS